MTSPHKFLRVAAAAALGAAAVLAACGGGDDNNNDNPAPPTSAVPLSASESSAGFIAYLQMLVQADADTLEPVDTSKVVGPTDETGEPVPVN